VGSLFVSFWLIAKSIYLIVTRERTVVAGLGSTWWQYLLLFLAIGASWAGVPFIGTAALGAAAVAASQDRLGLAAVIGVSVLAGEVGGLGGYAIGRRWGRRLLERPGKHQVGREEIRQRGERLYARWGWLAVFVTPERSSPLPPCGVTEGAEPSVLVRS